MDTVKALKEIYLFKGLPEDVVSLAAGLAERRQLRQGEVIVREGAPAEEMFVIRSGSVKVFKEAAGDAENVVVLGTGSHFGELSLLDDAPRSATVVANEPCELLSLSAAKLRAKVEANHELSHHLYSALARSLAKRLRQTTDDLGFARHLLHERFPSKG